MHSQERNLLDRPMGDKEIPLPLKRSLTKLMPIQNAL